jgi:hypothetical protein
MSVVTSIRSLLQPFWVRALVAACPLPIVMTVMFASIGREAEFWGWELGFTGVVALVAGLIGAALTEPAHLAYTEALEDLPADQRSAAVTAMWRGPVPDDARVRDAAIRVGEAYLAKSRRRNHAGIGVSIGVSLDAPGNHTALRLAAQHGRRCRRCSGVGSVYVRPHRAPCRAAQGRRRRRRAHRDPHGS